MSHSQGGSRAGRGAPIGEMVNWFIQPSPSKPLKEKERVSFAPRCKPWVIHWRRGGNRRMRERQWTTSLCMSELQKREKKKEDERSRGQSGTDSAPPPSPITNYHTAIFWLCGWSMFERGGWTHTRTGFTEGMDEVMKGETRRAGALCALGYLAFCQTDGCVDGSVLLSNRHREHTSMFTSAQSLN